MNTEHTFNSYSGPFPRLVDLQDLSPSRKELILSHCGFPRTDASKDGRTDPGTGKLPVVSAPGFSHRMSCQQTGHNLETGCPQSPETPLSKIMNLMRWKIHSYLPPSVHFKVIPPIHSKVTP